VVDRISKVIGRCEVEFAPPFSLETTAFFGKQGRHLWCERFELHGQLDKRRGPSLRFTQGQDDGKSKNNSNSNDELQLQIPSLRCGMTNKNQGNGNSKGKGPKLGLDVGIALGAGEHGVGFVVVVETLVTYRVISSQVPSSMESAQSE
jgi:hypothetical protein